MIGGFLISDRITQWSERGLFGDEIVHAETTPYQRIVVTRWHDDMRLYLNGNLRSRVATSSAITKRWVHPVLGALPWAKNVLVLGGGDGLAVREILKYQNIERITLVDLDPAMTKLFSTATPFTTINQARCATSVCR